MTTYNWLQLFGIPGLLGALLMFLGGCLIKCFEAQKAQKKASQALLRDRLYVSYQFCARKGYTELWERDNFQNMYTQYHALGANGVMDDTRERFFELPDKTEYEMRGK